MSRRKKNSSIRSAVISLAAVLIVAVSYFATSQLTDKSAPAVKVNNSSETLTVHYFDVGQGDSEFIEFPNGECMLIDAGTADCGEDIVDEIEQLGYDSIDYLVATHPHADHIGGMQFVIESLDVENIYMPRALTDTRTYENLLSAISKSGLKISTAKAGKTIVDDSGLKAEFLSPVSESYEELNNYSCVMKLTYEGSSFLFTGDAEKEVEEELVSLSCSTLDCDVLKAGHHGSRYSSTNDFLRAVSPDIAVISCGRGNTYNHPHTQALDRLNKAGAQIYRTDELGEIIITTSGDGNYEVDNR